MQHQAFASRHRPDYYSGPHWLVYGRADGIPNSPVGMVACGDLRVGDGSCLHERLRRPQLGSKVSNI
ncbi:hypothetical protein CLIM01_00133 [Colletotrichum limetticola]|uniref:Uncharacterized protein n=1 Tax=Colletotrichum limetticola TaxID=1209924 RepID=A0ABQ9QF67_9PEZI|nr:hypothetical protein CLIM01_00133 [Colletotrichum limetticola]